MPFLDHSLQHTSATGGEEAEGGGGNCRLTSHKTPRTKDARLKDGPLENFGKPKMRVYSAVGVEGK